MSTGRAVPHVVVRGPSDLAQLHQALEPIIDRSAGSILKTTRSYIDQEQDRVVVECLAIEGDQTSQFFALISKRDDGVVVRLHEAVDVERSDGVKRLLALLGTQVRRLDGSYSFGETNLDDFLVGVSA